MNATPALKRRLRREREMVLEIVSQAVTVVLASAMATLNIPDICPQPPAKVKNAFSISGFSEQLPICALCWWWTHYRAAESRCDRAAYDQGECDVASQPVGFPAQVSHPVAPPVRQRLRVRGYVLRVKNPVITKPHAGVGIGYQLGESCLI